jgi:small redox-active disulfide protein 2
VDVKVLGTGCAKCRKLYEQAEKGVAEAGVTVNLAKVEKLDEIMAYAVMMTPALVVNGEVKSTGRIPATSEIAAWIKDAAAQ